MSATAGSYDVAVIGAGPAGAATARHLAGHGCRVLLTECSRFEAARVGESLAPEVRRLLEDLGVWERFSALEPVPSWGTRSVWGDPSPNEHSHLFSPYGCGWHVERRLFDQMLAEAAAEAGAVLQLGTTLTSCRADAANWRLELATGTMVRSASVRVVVDATGRGARVARRLGAQRDVFDTLVGVAVQFGDVSCDMQGFTLVEATEDGWWYSAPVRGDRMVTMLMTDSDLCGRARLTSMGNWLTGLRAVSATSVRVADARAEWGPRAFSAISQRSRHGSTMARWLTVGDAALAVDPISGSGVVRALRSARAGAEAARELLSGARWDALREYEMARDRECAVYLGERAMYYGAEDRWRESRFWQRRVRGT